jgi:hypothetical protein
VSVPEKSAPLKELEPAHLDPIDDPIAKAELNYILKLKEAPFENLFPEPSPVPEQVPAEPAESVLRETRYKVPENSVVEDSSNRFHIRREDIVWAPKD